MKKMTKLFIICLIAVFFITACSDDSDDEILEKDYNTDGLIHTSCTRDAYSNDSSTTISINIDLYSDNDGYLNIFKSKEEIKSSNTTILDQYEEAYNKIYASYKDVDYYDSKVTREDNKVTSITNINYAKVDMDKILEIEGTENNVKVENGKIKLSDWKSFAKKYGTTCTSE